MTEPWKIYFDEFRHKAEAANRQLYDREDELAKAAHEAYRRTADRLSETERWTDDDALTLTRAFNQTVKEWIPSEEHDLDALRENLRDRWAAWRRAHDGD